MAIATQRLELIEIFRSLSEIPLMYKDKNEALKKITELGRQALGSHACTLTFIDLEEKYLVQVACAGFDREFEEHMANRKIKLGSLIERVFMDFDLSAKGEIVEKYNLQRDGQGLANPRIAKKYSLDAILCYPLRSEGRLIGYFNHFSSTSNHFTLDEKRLLEIFARQAVITIENLENLTSRKRLEKLNEIMQEMTEARDVDSLLKLILARGLELVASPKGGISRLDINTGELDIVAHKGPPSEFRHLRPGQGITGRALQAEKPIRADDIRDSQWRGIYEEYWADTRSELAVPILISNAEVRVGDRVALGSKPIGVFNVESPNRGAFSQADGELLWSLARHAAIMIERLEFDRKLANMTRVQAEIVGKRDWDDIIQIMLREITSTLGYDYVNISLVIPELNRIKTAYITGIAEHRVEEFKQLADHSLASDDIQAYIVRSRQIEVPDIEDKRFDPEIYKRFDHGRLIRVFVPMIAPSDNRVMGTVEAGYQRSYRKYIYEQDVQILKGFVDYAVRALEQRQRGQLDKISHELRAPIVGIRNNASFLQRRSRDLDGDLIQRKFDDILTDCEILLLQVKKLEHILGRISPTAKIEKTLVFRDVIIKVFRQFKPLVIEQGFDTSRIEYDSSDIHKVRPIYIDKMELNQVVYNLLTNSIKYAENDPNTFRIRIVVDETKDAFIIKFRDWGIGIKKGLEEKIFEEGFRAPEAINKHVTGSGLGLTIAKKSMQVLGGDLRLANTYKPTEFHIVLPKRLEEFPYDSRG